MPRTTQRTPLALLLVVAPIVLGAAVMRLGGAPPARWLAQLAAVPIGVLLYGVVTRIPRLSRRALLAAAAAGFATVACTLAAPDVLGVHRWLVVAAVRLNASQVVMPALVVLMATNIRRSPALVVVLLLAMQALHWLQPDAGQASAVAAASLVILLGGAAGVASLVCAVVSAGFAGATWMRGDPLSAAPFVEDILPRAFGVHWLIGCLGVAFLAGSVLAPVEWPRPRSAPATKLAQCALAVYFAMAVLVTFVGEFPVPLLGFGASPIFGAFLGLAALRRAGTQDSALRIAESAAGPSDLGPVSVVATIGPPALEED